MKRDLEQMLVCITARDELPEYLSNTITSVQEAFPKNDYIIIDDGSRTPVFESNVIKAEGKGIDPARHLALEYASEYGYTHVLLLDSHMLLDESSYHGIERYFLKCDIEMHSGCLACWSINEKWEYKNLIGYGARIKQLFHYEEKDNRKIATLFKSEWNKSAIYDGMYKRNCIIEIGEILGGAYVIPVDYYFDIGAPWETAKGWGTSEQCYSIVSYLQGGKLYSLPGRAGHLFTTKLKKKQGKCQRYPFDHGAYIYNQLRLYYALFDDDDTGYRHLLKSREAYLDMSAMCRQADNWALNDIWVKQMQTHTLCFDRYAGKWKTDVTLPVIP